ncbi:hypothetical protein [Rufibacter quisquiliarum]|uniref:Uncharacterized protein n=1 Tax=Rufibacter quisquiliarum TaxID=1549639 RepID=A0A839GMZ5_9BACT|nr:hypothetical protein [Rufibacter quisquiliarum]MBA9076326.1 hypothetical protein [Rufibacter quisquiliarum]
MKKFLSVSFLFLLSCVAVQAQTKSSGTGKPSFEDSKEWLDVKFVAYHCDINKSKGIKKVLTEEGITIDGGEVFEESIKWGDVKNFIIDKKMGKIRVIGDNVRKDKKKGENTKQTDLDLYLCKDTPYDEMQKMVKALQHAATLKGAKLVKDDMF